MAEPLSWIRLNRNITTWRHWKNHRVAIVFLWLLTKAQYGEESYIGSTKICRGEVVTSIDRIAEENGISYQQVRDVVKTLKKTGEISTRKGQRFVIIKIENYEKYQPVEGYAEQTETKQRTDREQTENTLRTNRKQHYKKVYKDRKVEGKETGVASLPSSVEEIVPERDLDGFPDFEHMPCEADGSKRDIPPRVRKLFVGDYGAYYRYMERMYGECSTKQS